MLRYRASEETVSPDRIMGVSWREEIKKRQAHLSVVERWRRNTVPMEGQQAAPLPALGKKFHQKSLLRHYAQIAMQRRLLDA